MSDLYIADNNGAVVAGYYSKDKMISYVTGTAKYDQGDDVVALFAAGFNKDLPLGTVIHVQTNKDLGYGLDYDQPLITADTPEQPFYDLLGEKIGLGPVIWLSHTWKPNELYKKNGTYDFTISYNGMNKSFKVIINAQKTD